MKDSNIDLAIAKCLENAETTISQKISGFPSELVQAHLSLFVNSIKSISRCVDSIGIDTTFYDDKLLEVLRSPEASVHIEALANNLPLEMVHDQAPDPFGLLLVHEQHQIEQEHKKLGFHAERLAHFKITMAKAGYEFSPQEFIQLHKKQMPHGPKQLDQKITEFVKVKFGEGFEIPEASLRSSFWQSKIEQSLVYEKIDPENLKVFIDTLNKLEDEFSRPPEFYVNVFASNGIAASKAGNLVNLLNGEPTGFYNSDTNRTEATAGDMVKEALLEILPSNLNESAEFGVYFEFAARTAFEALYEKEHGVKLTSILDGQMRKELNRCEAVYPYKVGLDQLYMDEKNDKLILTDFKVPSVLSRPKQKSSDDATMYDDNRYQANIYQEAVYFATGRVPDETVVFQFGMDGMKDLLPLMKDENNKKLAVAMVNEQVRRGIASGDLKIRTKPNKIKRDQKLVSGLLIDAANHFTEGYLKLGIPPEEPEVGKKAVGKELGEVEKMLTQYAINKELAEQVQKENEKIKERLNEIKTVLDVDVIKGECASTSSRSQQPPEEILFKRAREAGLDINIADVSEIKVNEGFQVCPVKLGAVCQQHSIDISHFRTQTNVVKKNTDYNFRNNLQPKLEALASQVITQTQGLSKAYDQTAKVDVKVNSGVTRDQAPSASDLGYSNSISM